MGVFLVFPLLIEYRSYKKTCMEHSTSCITHHATHITYEFVSFILKKIVIRTVVAFNSSFKLILNKFVNNFFLWKWLNWQYKLLCQVQNKSNQPFQCETTHFAEKLVFSQKSRKSQTLVFFQVWLTKIWGYEIREHAFERIFNTLYCTFKYLELHLKK